MKIARFSINQYGFTLGVFAIVLLHRLASYLAPIRLYFSFSSFIVEQNSFRFGSIIIALFIPFITGFLLLYIPYRWASALGRDSTYYKNVIYYILYQLDLTAGAAGFFASLLLAWPFIVYWDILARPDIRQLRAAFIFAYFLYFMAHAYFCQSGANTALCSIQKKLPPQLTAPLEEQGKSDFYETFRTSFMGVLSSGIATYIALALGAPV